MNNTHESVEYRDVVGFPGYRVGADGSVWSSKWCGRIASPRGEWHKRRTYKTKSGRVLTSLFQDGVQHMKLVHRLVLEAFVGPCPPGMECCHNDGNPANNQLPNLRWDTSAANKADMARHGRQRRGEKVYGSKLNEEKVRAIRVLAAEGVICKEIARRYGITGQSAWRVVRRKSWQHVG